MKRQNTIRRSRYKNKKRKMRTIRSIKTKIKRYRKSRKSKKQKGGWFWQQFKKTSRIEDIPNNNNSYYNNNEMCTLHNITSLDKIPSSENRTEAIELLENECCNTIALQQTPYCKQLKENNAAHIRNAIYDTLDLNAADTIYTDYIPKDSNEKYKIGQAKERVFSAKLKKPTTKHLGSSAMLFANDSLNTMQQQYNTDCPKRIFGLFKNNSAYCKQLEEYINIKKTASN